MRNNSYVRSALAQVALDLVPPLIRESLIRQRAFRKEYGFKANVVMSLSDIDISLRRSTLFGAIRSVLSGNTNVHFNDIKDEQWCIELEGGAGVLPTLVICRDGRRVTLPDFISLSPDADIRLRSLNESSADVNLPRTAIETWRDILSERSLEDDEVEEYHSDFRNTPVHVARSIRVAIENGDVGISTIVRPSRRYLERLVGIYDGSSSINDYASGSGRIFLESLSAWQPYDGFLFSLFLSSHSSITAEINADGLSSEDLVHALEFLDNQGDVISQLGAVEVGLRVLPQKPEIAPLLIRLIEKLRVDDVEGSESQFKLLSALFVLIDGELSRTRILSHAPPFYRRLASLSQAALVQRQMMDSNIDIDIDEFCKWAFSNRGEQFYFQSLADMRLEPRWNPSLSIAEQMKQDFLGRLMNSGKKYENNIVDEKLHDLLLGHEPGSLLSVSDIPRPYYPGPLEGGITNPNALPAEMVEAVETPLRTKDVGPDSFIALVNSALLFRVELVQAELAAEALKLGRHRLANNDDRRQIFAVLNGLATVAAVSRSHLLADELRILVRIYRREPRRALSIDEAIRICAVASASRSTLQDWRDYLGEWLTELAFDDLQDNEGRTFHSHLQCLLHAVPELWVSCARADAALAAFNAR